VVAGGEYGGAHRRGGGAGPGPRDILGRQVDRRVQLPRGRDRVRVREHVRPWGRKPRNGGAQQRHEARPVSHTLPVVIALVLLLAPLVVVLVLLLASPVLLLLTPLVLLLAATSAVLLAAPVLELGGAGTRGPPALAAPGPPARPRHPRLHGGRRQQRRRGQGRGA
jgi:hypothetical protein